MGLVLAKSYFFLDAPTRRSRMSAPSIVLLDLLVLDSTVSPNDEDV